jgi:cell division protease FtsH
LRDSEQARLTDGAYSEAVRLVTKHRAALDRIAHALLEKETLNREEIDNLFADVPHESTSSAAVGTPQVVSLPSD